MTVTMPNWILAFGAGYLTAAVILWFRSWCRLRSYLAQLKEGEEDNGDSDGRSE